MKLVVHKTSSHLLRDTYIVHLDLLEHATERGRRAEVLRSLAVEINNAANLVQVGLEPLVIQLPITEIEIRYSHPHHIPE